MYRYLLFFYYDYYPSGGMEDCELKTNNFDDLEKYINENLLNEYWYQSTISYYDSVENKIMYANIEDYYGEDYRAKYKFLGWEER